MNDHTQRSDVKQEMKRHSNSAVMYDIPIGSEINIFPIYLSLSQHGIFYN